jgi:hypothetical protein
VTAGQFLQDDGFANVLLDTGFTAPKYLFLPYDALPKDEQLFKMQQMDRGPRGQPPVSVRINDFETSFPDDTTWETYAKQTFASAWDHVKQLTSASDSAFG